jgi:hypothetical protein
MRAMLRSDSDSKEAAQREEHLLEEVTSETAKKILGERGYLLSLEKRFEVFARNKGLE